MDCSAECNVPFLSVISDLTMQATTHFLLILVHAANSCSPKAITLSLCTQNFTAFLAFLFSPCNMLKCALAKNRSTRILPSSLEKCHHYRHGGVIDGAQGVIRAPCKQRQQTSKYAANMKNKIIIQAWYRIKDRACFKCHWHVLKHYNCIMYRSAFSKVQPEKMKTIWES